MIIKFVLVFCCLSLYGCHGCHEPSTDTEEDLTEDEVTKENEKLGVFADKDETQKIEEENLVQKELVHVDYRETRFDDDDNVVKTEKSYPKNEMVNIPKGSFMMGMEDSPFPGDGEEPERHVTMRPYSIDKFEVSNGEFAEFVAATKYKTEAELFGNSFVMEYFLAKEVEEEIDEAVANANWWLPVHGANWKRPEGRGSNIDDRMDHPVVHVSWNDAHAFCKWKGKRLPTEAEWEFACRGGLSRKLFPWGDDLKKDDKFHANIWQGKFPKQNSAEDGYNGSCQVDRFLQNDYQLYNMVGNVWEWVADWWTTTHSSRPVKNPFGPSYGTEKMKKGGSFMCHKNYCYRYRCAARSSNSADSSALNLGFRCAKSRKKPQNQEAKKDEL